MIVSISRTAKATNKTPFFLDTEVTSKTYCASELYLNNEVEMRLLMLQINHSFKRNYKSNPTRNLITVSISRNSAIRPYPTLEY